MQPQQDSPSLLNIERAIEALTRATLKAQNNIKQVPFFALSVDGAGGAANTADYGLTALFTVANPAAFARSSARVPADWKPNTDITIRFLTCATNGSTHAWNYYLGCNGQGSNITTPAWNVAANATLASQAYTANILTEKTLTVPAGLISTGALIGLAIRPVAITPNVIFYGAIIEYTAQ